MHVSNTVKLMQENSVVRAIFVIFEAWCTAFEICNLQCIYFGKWLAGWAKSHDTFEWIYLTKCCRYHSIIVREWGRFFIFQKELVYCFPDIIHIGMVCAATLQSLCISAKANILWSQIFKRSLTNLDRWVCFFECTKCTLQCYLHHPNWNTTQIAQVIFDYSSQIFVR